MSRMFGRKTKVAPKKSSSPKNRKSPSPKRSSSPKPMRYPLSQKPKNHIAIEGISKLNEEQVRDLLSYAGSITSVYKDPRSKVFVVSFYSFEEAQKAVEDFRYVHPVGFASIKFHYLDVPYTYIG